MRKRTRAREIVLTLLYQKDIISDETEEELLERYWAESSVTDPEIVSFTEEIFKGVRQNLPFIDQTVSQFTDNWELSRMAIIDRNILRFSCYELLFREDIPPKVTINESINIAKKFSQEESGKFVNGVLDQISHQSEKLLEKKNRKP